MTAGNNPTTDRSKLGTKRHVLTDKQGIPLSAVISSAKTHDIKLVTDDVVDNVWLSGDGDDHHPNTEMGEEE